MPVSINKEEDVIPNTLAESPVIEPKELLESINREADAAAEIAMASFGRASASLKADLTYVTEADLEIEAALRRSLPGIIKGSIVVGEEKRDGGAQRAIVDNAQWVWVIDPIDGTSVFIDGLPFFCVSIGLMKNGRPYAGALRFPATGDNYEGARGYGSFYNGEKIRLTRKTKQKGEPALYVPSKCHLDYRISYPGKCRSLGSTASHFALLARGAAKGALARGFAWDFAAAAAILLEAGGVMRYLDGQEIDWPALIARRGTLEKPILGAPPGQWSELAAMIERI